MCINHQNFVKLQYLFTKSVESVLPWKLLTPENGIHLLPEACAKHPNAWFANIKGQRFDFANKRFFVLGFGKAVLGMAVQLEKYLKHVEGILSVPHGTLNKCKDSPHMTLRADTRITVMEGARGNFPDMDALKAATAITNRLDASLRDTIVFVLVSGGGSALLPYPRAPFSLGEKMNLIRCLSNAGASIDEMNLVRIALSNVKGGRLLPRLKHAAAIISFIISDIVGDPPELIASGPTVPLSRNQGRRTPQEILRKYDLWQNISDDKRAILLEFLPTCDDFKNINNNFHYIVGNNAMAVDATVELAKECDYVPCVLSTTLQGNVCTIVEQYIMLLNLINAFRCNQICGRELREQFPFDCKYFDKFYQVICTNADKSTLLILSGEPTVKVTGSGIGGRNQQLALQMSYKMYSNPDLHDYLFFSAGTDGIDGPTPAAGAFGCAQVVKDELKKYPAGNTKHCVLKYIENNDAYNFYAQLENGKYHILTGHTGINVMDLHFILVPALSNTYIKPK